MEGLQREGKGRCPDALPHRLPGRVHRELVPGPRHGPRQRRGQGRLFRARRPSRLSEEDDPVAAPRVGLCAAPAGRPGPPGLDGFPEGDAAQLDRQVPGRGDGVPDGMRRAVARRHHLHHPGRHRLRRDLHGPRPGERVGSETHLRRAEGGRRRLPGAGQEEDRARTHRRQGGDGRVLRRLCNQSAHRGESSRLDRRIRSRRLRYGRHHGRSGPRQP